MLKLKLIVCLNWRCSFSLSWNRDPCGEVLLSMMFWYLTFPMWFVILDVKIWFFHMLIRLASGSKQINPESDLWYQLIFYWFLGQPKVIEPLALVTKWVNPKRLDQYSLDTLAGQICGLVDALAAGQIKFPLLEGNSLSSSYSVETIAIQLLASSSSLSVLLHETIIALKGISIKRKHFSS